MNSIKLNRRKFLKSSAALAGGLVIGFQISGCDQQPHLNANAELVPNAWLKISKNNDITLLVDKSEMGQGVSTSLPTLIAEELEIDFSKIKVEFAPAARVYVNRLFMVQATGGSTSISSSWKHLRKVGATARQLLINAAAHKWQVPAEECRAIQGEIHHGLSQRIISYGELVDIASALPKPSAPLKPQQDFKLIGQATPRIDNFDKSTGRAQFGIDVDLPNTLIAVVVRCPVFGGKVKQYDASQTLKQAGITQVVKISSGIAVVGESYWQVRQAAATLDVSWDYGALESLSSEQYDREM